MSVTYGPGVPADREAIIDFINYVFSQAHRPHDFKKLIPKTYGDPGEEFEKWHFLAKSEKGIRAGTISESASRKNGWRSGSPSSIT